MKFFIKNVVLFFVPILFVAILIELLVRQIPNDYSFKKSYLDKNSSEIETLILGSSHSYYGINPVYFSSNCFNASHVSQTLNYDLKILEKYENQLINLKTVILPISYFTYFSNLEEGREFWRVKNYSIYYKMTVPFKIGNYFEVLNGNLGSIFYKMILTYFRKGNFVSCSELGCGSYSSEVENDLAKTGLTACSRHTQENLNYLDNLLKLQTIIEFCKKINVRIVLITLPAYKTYRELLDEKQLDITINESIKVAEKYENCVYLNMLDDKRFVSSDFYDADHLNEIGAKKLSLIINKIVDDGHIYGEAKDDKN